MIRRGLKHRGFLLLETMIGVAIFSLGVIVLARCVENCISAELLRSRDQLARIALENRMAEIVKRSVTLPEDSREVELEGRFAGFTVRETATPLALKNENDQELEGLYKVDLEVIWTKAGEEQSRSLSFYVSNQ